MFKKKYEAVKKHLDRHRVIYISGAVGVLSAGITYVITREAYAGIIEVPDGHIVTVRPLSFLSKQIVNVVTVIEREGRGHPGYRILCLETGEIFESQRKASEALLVFPGVVSDHLRGKVEDIHGLHFQRIQAQQIQLL